MRGIIVWMIIFMSGVAPAMAQQGTRLDPREPVVCYQSFENRREFIAPARNGALRNARTKSATFDVEYVGFPDDAAIREAVAYALSIWESELISTVPIRVRVEWRSLRPGVLGEAIWGSAYANFGGEPEMNTFYPVALAEKLAGRQLNAPDEPDIIATFNSETSWYFGLDGNTPAGKMDFVTIVLHEIAHGLGFTHSYRVNGPTGTLGLSSGTSVAPLAFDLFVEDQTQKNLFQEFDAPSAALANALQSGALFFRSAEGPLPRLYAPSTFSAGSSISHLDEATYNGSGDANRLMTPQIAMAEAIHDPGDVVRDIFATLGWITTRIVHTPLKDTERHDGEPYTVFAEVVADEVYEGEAVKLHYTIDGISFTTVDMSHSVPPNRFVAELPGTLQPRTYGYYLSVVNGGQQAVSPGRLQTQGSAPEQGLHYFRIGPDVDAPEIRHVPTSFIFADYPALTLEAEVSDNLAVASVLVEYNVNDGPTHTATLEHIGNDLYRSTLTFDDLEIGDLIHYRLVASDMSVAINTTSSPEEGVHRITVVGILPARSTYTNNFDTPSDDFFGTGFSIATPSGFANGAIHSDHPYQNGSGPNDESHYTYQLQIPIILRDSAALLSFDEIVLVEPGTNSSVFGDAGFYDYVIVEGSADGGLTWWPLVAGYDSRANSVWLSRYNSHIVDHISLAVGEPSLFRRRAIDLLDNEYFDVGDQVLIRFRLFADQLANGWGWAIDNLVIQQDPSVTGVVPDPAFGFDVYPVPADNILSLAFSGKRPVVFVDIVDVQGRAVLSFDIEPEKDIAEIDISALPAGVYMVRALAGDKRFLKRLVKR
jgi:hypothetical protein